jgi:hypothetical protein
MCQRVEPWMDVLFVGLSPELIPAEGFPSHLATVRQGGNIPADPWDAVFVRFGERQDEVIARILRQASRTLRHGGQLGLVALAPAPDDDSPLLQLLAPLGGSPESARTDDGALVVVVRQLQAGRQDLVGLRRCLSALMGNVERLEALCADIRERSAGRRPVEGGPSLKEMVGHLGDLDRDGYLACIRSCLGEAPAPAVPIDLEAIALHRDHNARPFAELVTRLRHFRFQALDVLRDLAEDDWLRTCQGPDGREATISDLVRTWVRTEEERVLEIEARLG